MNKKHNSSPENTQIALFKGKQIRKVIHSLIHVAHFLSGK